MRHVYSADGMLAAHTEHAARVRAMMLSRAEGHVATGHVGDYSDAGEPVDAAVSADPRRK